MNFNYFISPDRKPGITVGMMVQHPAQSINGWLPCDGRSLSRKKYKELFKVIGTSYGSGVDSFNLPDLRGKVLNRVCCVVCKQPYHYTVDHPFCKNNLEYLEWKLEQKERSIR